MNGIGPARMRDPIGPYAALSSSSGLVGNHFWIDLSYRGAILSSVLVRILAALKPELVKAATPSMRSNASEMIRDVFFIL